MDNKPDAGSKDMQVERETGDANTHDKGCGIKERVSFRTNMTTDEESSDGNLMVKMELELATVVERLRAWKFGAKHEKRGALKVHCTGVSKKQNTPIKLSVQGVLKGLDKDGMEDMLQLMKSEPGGLMEVSIENLDGALKLEPQNLTGTHGKAHKEQ
jgi:hypothetical protein